MFESFWVRPRLHFQKFSEWLLFRSFLWMCVQNLKFLALLVPEIIGGTQKIWKNHSTTTWTNRTFRLTFLNDVMLSWKVKVVTRIHYLKLNISKIFLDNGGFNGTLIGSHTLRVERSRDRRRHVTLNDQIRDPKHLILIISTKSTKCSSGTDIAFNGTYSHFR